MGRRQPGSCTGLDIPPRTQGVQLDVFRRDGVVPLVVEQQSVLCRSRQIHRLDLAVEFVVPLVITALPPVEEVLRNVADIGLDVNKQADVGVLGEGSISGCTVAIDIHLNPPDTALAYGPCPDKGGEEWLILGYSVASLDEPLHRVHLPAAVQAAPVSLVSETCMKLLVVADPPLRAVVLSRLPILNFDHGELFGGALSQALHDGPLYHSEPGIGRLEDLNTAVDCIAQTLL